MYAKTKCSTIVVKPNYIVRIQDKSSLFMKGNMSDKRHSIFLHMYSSVLDKNPPDEKGSCQD